MSILLAIIVGGIVGWLAALMAGRDEGVLGSIVIGIVGAILGGVLSSLFGNTGYMLFSWMGLFWTFIGAIVLVALLNAIQYGPNRHL